MTVEQTYLALLRSALWGTDMPVVDNVQEVLELADRQKTRGLVYELLLRSGVEIPPETSCQMQRMLMRIVNTHLVFDRVIKRTVSALQEASIPCVLLKGEGVARYYPNPRLRECGDVDLYIGPERLEEALRLLAPMADRVADRQNGKHWELKISQVEVELHQHSMQPETRRRARLFPSEEIDGLTRNLIPLDFDGVSVDTPADTFNAFYLFYHAWHHFADGKGVGLRQLCDWTLLLHARSGYIDREHLRVVLEGMNLIKPWQLFGSIAVQQLGLPSEEFPFYDDSRPRAYSRVLRLVLDDGNFGMGRRNYHKRRKGYLAGKLSSFSCHCQRFFLVFPLAPRATLSRLPVILFKGFQRVFQDLFHH